MDNIVSFKKGKTRIIKETRNAFVKYLAGIERYSEWKLSHGAPETDYRKKVADLHYPTIIEMWKEYKKANDKLRKEELEYVLFESYGEELSIEQIFLFDFSNHAIRSKVFQYFQHSSDDAIEASFNFLHKFVYETSLKMQKGRDRDNKLKKAQVLIATHCPQLLSIKEIFELPFLSLGIGRHIERAVETKKLKVGEGDIAIINFYVFDPSAQKIKKKVAKKIKKLYSI